MYKTFLTSFSLKNTYRVNTILYSLKQIPLIKRALPAALYSSRPLKTFAGVIAAVWEVISAFLGKLLYFLIMIIAAMMMYKNADSGALFLHILLFLSIIGGFLNTNLFNPSKDKFYAIILMRMDAREYTRTNYGYAILKVIVGFMPFCIIFGAHNQIPLWLCLILPFSVAGLKITVSALTLYDYEKSGFAYNENKLSKWIWGIAALILAAAYGLPAIGIVLPENVSALLFLLFIPAGVIGAVKIWNFNAYREIYQKLLSQSKNQMDSAAQRTKKLTEKSISADINITSGKKGFEYLNELFIKRHKSILWDSSIKIAAVCLVLMLAANIAVWFIPESREATNKILMTFLPYFVFIMYAINRGTGFTKALFLNCDHSLLTYSFYKQPKMVLKLFAIRLKEIMKINLLPAFVIGAGLSALLYVSGGTDNPLNYAVVFVSILTMSMFFSVHYLVIYYLLQPYNAATEIKSGTYKIITAGTYLVCYFMMQLRLPTLLFGTACIVFCVLYCIIACILVYHFAPKTFRIRL